MLKNLYLTHCRSKKLGNCLQEISLIKGFSLVPRMYSNFLKVFKLKFCWIFNDKIVQLFNNSCNIDVKHYETLVNPINWRLSNGTKSGVRVAWFGRSQHDKKTKHITYLLLKDRYFWKNASWPNQCINHLILNF